MGPVYGGSPGEHLVEHAAERVYIGALIHVALGRRLLGTHVLRRAEADAALGQPLSDSGASARRDAEVGDQGMAPGRAGCSRA